MQKHQTVPTVLMTAPSTSLGNRTRPTFPALLESVFKAYIQIHKPSVPCQPSQHLSTLRDHFAGQIKCCWTAAWIETESLKKPFVQLIAVNGVVLRFPGGMVWCYSGPPLLLLGQVDRYDFALDLCSVVSVGPFVLGGLGRMGSVVAYALSSLE